MAKPSYAIDAEDLAAAHAAGRAFAAELAEREVEPLDLDRALAPYAAERFSGEVPAVPTLHLDDVSDIPFLIDISGVEEYQHRARLRAGDGDLFAAATAVTDGYEAYCRERLQLGSARFVAASPGANPVQVTEGCRRSPVLESLIATARRDGLGVHPYMGIEAVWQLARTVAEGSGRPVEVIAPPPPVTWIANDKAHFEDLVAITVGREWLVESRRSREPPVLARALHELAERYTRVALKRLRCASAMGNLVLAGEELRGRGQPAVEEEVVRFLARTEWSGDEDVLVCAWEETELSPSTQLWVPPLGSGPPRLDGIYEQILAGETGVFVGSRPSRLPEPVHAGLARAALRVAAALQSLGYAGRCSFDHLVLGDPAGDFTLRFTECNGRWGGTSTPMSLVDRVVPGDRPPYRAQDFVRAELVGVTFPEVLRRAGDAVFDATTGRGRFLFYNVGPLFAHGKLDVIALGATQDEAEAAMLEELPARLGV